MMIRFFLLMMHALLAIGCVAAAPWAAAQTIEPRRIATPAELRPGEGALLLSIRHQTPIAETMHVRFEAVDAPARVLKFERKVGMGGRTRMLERQLFVYAVPAGRWRLAAHLAGCDDSIAPGEECRLTIAGRSFPLPSGTYPADWLVVEVPAGGFADAGEINLEAPAGTVLGVPLADGESLETRIRQLRFRHRPLAAAAKPAAQAFAGLPAGRVAASAEAASATTCERPAKALKLYYNPFTC